MPRNEIRQAGAIEMSLLAGPDCWVSTSLVGTAGIHGSMKSGSDLRTHFLSQKTLQNSCLHFRKTLPQFRTGSCWDTLTGGIKIRNCQCSFPEHMGFFLWKHQSAGWDSKSEQRDLGGYFYVVAVFSLSASPRTGMFTSEPAPHSACLSGVV